ncbi:MAG: hypothetical protein Tsb0034_19640 [Ekhidna sp.]
MKRYLTLLVFLFLSYCGLSQDTIVTVEGDTIECQITRISETFIHFSVIDKSGVLLMRSRLPLSKIQTYDRVSQLESEAAEERVEPPERLAYTDAYSPPNIRVAVNGGFTYQFGGYEGLPKPYKDKMQLLWNLGGEAHYYLFETFGVGVKYAHIFTKLDHEFEPPFYGPFGLTEIKDERIRFDYYGLSLAYRTERYSDQHIQYFLSGGMIKYKTEGTGDGVPFYQEGETLGVILGVTYDFLLTNHIGVGFGTEVTLAKLTELNSNGFVSPANFSISRIDLAIGLRYYR